MCTYIKDKMVLSLWSTLGPLRCTSSLRSQLYCVVPVCYSRKCSPLQDWFFNINFVFVIIVYIWYSQHKKRKSSTPDNLLVSTFRVNHDEWVTLHIACPTGLRQQCINVLWINRFCLFGPPRVLCGVVRVRVTNEIALSPVCAHRKRSFNVNFTLVITFIYGPPSVRSVHAFRDNR